MMGEAVAYQSFPISAGTDLDLDLTIQDAAGVAVDLTNGTLRFVMIQPAGDTPVIDSDAVPATATITVTDATNGLVTVSIADTELDGLLGDYYYEVKFADSTGFESVTNRGVITIEASVT